MSLLICSLLPLEDWLWDVTLKFDSVDLTLQGSVQFGIFWASYDQSDTLHRSMQRYMLGVIRYSVWTFCIQYQETGKKIRSTFAILTET